MSAGVSTAGSLDARLALKSSGLVMRGTSNYNAWQFEQFAPSLGRRVLEIGCGVGNLTACLLERAESVVAVDVKPHAVAYCRERFGDTPKLQLAQRDVFREGLGPFAGTSFDTILLANVLEHLDDDAGAMRFCREILAPCSGRLLLLVPANKWCYGTLDAEVGHVRRYVRREIIELARASGFAIEALYAFNLIGALGWWANYCLLRRRGTNAEESSTQTGLYDRWLVKPSRWLEQRVRVPVGISLIGVLRAQPTAQGSRVARSAACDTSSPPRLTAGPPARSLKAVGKSVEHFSLEPRASSLEPNPGRAS